MKKKLLAAVLSVLMVLEGITVFAGIQSDMLQGMTPSRLYVYEDFNSGDNYFYRMEKGFIYKWYTNKPLGWYYNGYNSNETFSWLGSEDDGYFGYSGLGSDGKIVELLANDYNTNESKMTSNRLRIEDWENFDGSFAVSFDFLLPTQDTIENPNLMFLMHYADGSVNNRYIVAEFPQMTVKNGAVYANVFESEEWRTKWPSSITPTNIRVTNAEPGEWVNIAMVVTRVPDSARYSAICYINGVKVSVCNMDPSVVNTDNWPSFERASKTEDSGFGIQLRGSSADGEWLGIDNICYRVYSQGSDIQPVVTIENGASIAKIPVMNTELAQTNAPDYAKQGMIDLENATVTAKRYGADDKFFLNGSPEEVPFNLDKSERFSAVPVAGEDWDGEGVCQTVGVDGTEIAINIPSDLTAGERLVLEFEGLLDITGKEPMTKRVVVYTNDTIDAGVLSISATDFFGNDVEIDADSQWDTSIKTFSLETIDTEDCDLRLFDGETQIATTEFSDGVYTFTLNDEVVLAGGKTYTIKKGDNEYHSFTTKSGEIKYGEMTLSGGYVTVPYLNTTENDETVGFVAYSKNNDGIVLDIVCEEAAVEALNFGEIGNERELQYVANVNSIVLDNLTCDNAAENSIVISASEFDDENTTTVRGNLGLSSASKDAKLVVLKKSAIGEDDEGIYDAIVNAEKVEIDENGEYTVDFNFTNFSTGRYIIELMVGDSVYKTEKLYGTDNDSRGARELLNSANQALGETENCVQYILNEYEEDLELDYYVYNDLSSNADVAKYIFAYIDAEREKGNSTPFGTKQQFSSVFRQAAVAAAINQGGIIENIEDVEENIGALVSMPVSDWYNYREDVDNSRTDSWREGLLSRLDSYAKRKYDSLDEFNKIVQDCMVLEIVKNPGTVSNLMLCMNDFAQVAGFNSDLIKQKVVSKVSGKDYDGYSLAELKADMLEANQSNKYEGSSGGSGAGGISGSGNKVSISASLATGGGKEPIGSIEPEIKYTFDDIKSVSWATEAIEALAKDGIINGKEEGLFYPNDNITREEFTKLIVGVFGLTSENEDFQFEDVKTDDWSYKYIMAAYQNKIINGIGDGLFGYGRNITRQDASVIMFNALKNVYDVTETEAKNDFSDADAFADYATEAVGVLSGLKVINGYEDGSFRPENSLTRAEAAKLIYGLMGYIK